MIEDDISGFLRIPLAARPRHARDRWLPKMMNPAVHAPWHPPSAGVRKKWEAESVPQSLQTTERMEKTLE